jgi:hypothetical protein
MRLNRAVLAAFLCAGGPAAAGMCDPTDQRSPFNAAQWMTLEDAGATTSRGTVAPTSLTEDVTRMSDAADVLTERLPVENQPVEMSGPASGLPSTSTAPDREPESGLR